MNQNNKQKKLILNIQISTQNIKKRKRLSKTQEMKQKCQEKLKNKRRNMKRKSLFEQKYNKLIMKLRNSRCQTKILKKSFRKQEKLKTYKENLNKKDSNQKNKQKADAEVEKSINKTMKLNQSIVQLKIRKNFINNSLKNKGEQFVSKILEIEKAKENLEKKVLENTKDIQQQQEHDQDKYSKLIEDLKNLKKKIKIIKEYPRSQRKGKGSLRQGKGSHKQFRREQAIAFRFKNKYEPQQQDEENYQLTTAFNNIRKELQKFDISVIDDQNKNEEAMMQQTERVQEQTIQQEQQVQQVQNQNTQIHHYIENHNIIQCLEEIKNKIKRTNLDLEHQCQGIIMQLNIQKYLQ